MNNTYLKISDLKNGVRRVNLVAMIVKMDTPREISTRYGRTKVANAVIEDSSGRFTLVLWGENADKVKEGDTIKIENGYINEFNGELQLNIGKYGKISVIKE